MSDIRRITVGVGADIRDLEREFDAASRLAEDFARTVGRDAGNIKVDGPRDAFRAVTTEARDTQAQVLDLGSAFAPLVTGIKSSLGQAVAPLNRFASTFAAQFEEVGATVEALSIRVDDAMRFPAFLKRVEAFRSAFLSRFGLVTEGAKGQLAGLAQSSEADAAKFVAGFARSAEGVKQAVAPIPGDVGYALEAARHKGAGGFPAFAKGLDEIDEKARKVFENIGARSVLASGRLSPGPARARNRNKADLAATQGAVPATDNTTAATKARISGYERLAQVIKFVGQVERNINAVHLEIVQRDVKDIDRLIKVWLGFKKVSGVVSTFGSVANATFGKLRAPKISFDPKQSQIIRGMGSAADKASSSFKAMGAQVAVALGAFGLAFKAVAFLKDGIVSAAGLNETLSKTDAVLGNASGGVKAFADKLGADFGLVKKDTLDVAAGFGGLFKGLGKMSGEPLAKVSNDFTQLSADMSSFANVSMDEAGKALRTALSGNESDVLKGLGVATDEATVKAYAYANGIAKVGTELTNQQKMMARAGNIMAQTGDIQGDLEKTSGSTANQFRKFTGNVENLGAAIGTALLPAVDAGLAVLNTLASWAGSAFAGAQESVGGFVESISSGFALIQAAIENPKAAFEVFRLVALQALLNVGEYADTLGPNLAMVATYIKDNWLLLIGDAFDWTLNALKNLQSNFAAFGTAVGNFLADPTGGFQVDWTPLSDGFRATAAEFPELIKPALTDMSREIGAAAEPIYDAVQAKAERAKVAALAAADAAARRAAAQKAQGEGSEKEIVKFAKKLTEDTRSPMEEYAKTVGEIQEAFKDKLITETEGKRGLAAAADKLNPEKKFSAAVSASSAEGRSAILAATTGKNSDAALLATRSVASNTAPLAGILQDIRKALASGASQGVLAF